MNCGKTGVLLTCLTLYGIKDITVAAEAIIVCRESFVMPGIGVCSGKVGFASEQFQLHPAQKLHRLLTCSFQWESTQGGKK